MARLKCMTQLEASKGRQSDQEIDFRFGERPAVRDCRVEAPRKRESFTRDLSIFRGAGALVIASKFHRGLFSRMGAPMICPDRHCFQTSPTGRTEEHPHVPSHLR